MSRDDPTYSRMSSRFWSGASDEEWTDDMVILGAYLLTCQERTTEGLYRLPKGYMAEDLPGEWPMERLSESLAQLVDNGFVDYDEKARVVFLPNAMKYQRPDNTNQQTAAIRNLKSLPATRLWKPFVEAAKTYCEAFHKRLVEAFPKGLAQGLPQGDAQGDRDSLLSSTLLSSTSARAREDAQPVDKPVDNVDNSADQERGCSIEQEEPGQEPPPDGNGDDPVASEPAKTDKPGTCDGAKCSIREFPVSAFAPLRRVMLASLHPKQQKAVGAGGPIDALLEAYAAHICDVCQVDLGEFVRTQREPLCERALIVAIENLAGSANVAAVMRSRLTRFGLSQLIDDETFEDLRRTTRDKRRKGQPRPLGNPLEVASPKSTTTTTTWRQQHD